MKTQKAHRRREPWLEIYESYAPNQRALARELTKAREMLNCFDEAFSVLLSDEQFTTLLRAEGLDRVPTVITERTR